MTIAPSTNTAASSSNLAKMTQEQDTLFNGYIEHTPFDAHLWIGRAEPDESQRALYWYQVVQASTAIMSTAKVTLLGFACDQGVRRNHGRVGARFAPPAMRQAFAKLPLSAALQNKLSSTNLSSILADAGDIVCHDNDTLLPDVLEQTQAQFSQQVTNIIKEGGLAIGLGGGHAMAYASYLGLWAGLQHDLLGDLQADLGADVQGTKTESRITRHSNFGKSNTGNSNIGIINFDAHLDLRQAPNGTSGTPFRQIAEHCLQQQQPFHYCAIGISQFSNTAALFDRAEQLGVQIISDDACARKPWAAIEQQLLDFIARVEVIYLTIDMDGFAASIVPGVSAPAAKGISVDFVERCLEVIFASGKVKMADIAEINPTYDIDGRSVKVAARLLALMIEHHLLLAR